MGDICIFHKWGELRHKVGTTTWTERGLMIRKEKTRGVILICAHCGKTKAYIETTQGKRYKIAPWALDEEVR